MTSSLGFEGFADSFEALAEPDDVVAVDVFTAGDAVLPLPLSIPNRENRFLGGVAVTTAVTAAPDFPVTLPVCESDEAELRFES